MAASLALLLAGCGSTAEQSRLASTSASGSGGEGLSTGAAPGAAVVPGAGAGTGVPGASNSGAGPAGTTPGAAGTLAGGATPGGVPGARGATHGPITLGVLYAINDGAAPAGINNGNTFQLSDVVHDLVASYNAGGGISGRHINPVYFGLHSYSNDYEAQVTAACASFTQDNHVAAVVSNLQYYSDNLMSCLAKAGVALISGDFTGPDRHDAERYPAFITPVTLPGEDRETAVVHHLHASGFLGPRDRIGVILEGCAVDQRIYANGLVPALRREHLTLASTYTPQCFQSLQDFGTQTSQMSSAVLQFRRNNVDRVMFVSQSAEANLAFAFSEVAEQQHWTPGYALSSVAAAAALAQNASPDQMANARGVGWIPALDTQNPAQVPPTPAGRVCLNRLAREGVRPQSSVDYSMVYQACDSFGFFAALLRATRGDAASASIVRAVSSVGPGYAGAAVVGGRERLWSGHVGVAAGRLFAFTAGEGFHYISGPFAL